MKTIVIHSGPFHADDAFSVALMKIWLAPEELKIVRTRDPKLIATGDWIIDVGREYDPVQHKFDHHQSLLDETGRRPNGVPYASFGLLWKYYCEQEKISSQICERVDKVLVQPVDADDNGVKLFRSVIPDLAPFGISQAIESLVPPAGSQPEEYDTAFAKVLEITLPVLQAEISQAEKIAADRKKAEQLYEQSADKRYLVAEEGLDLELGATDLPELLLVVEPYASRKEWQLSTIEISPTTSFDVRRSLPAAWAGLEGETLQKVTGVPDAVFCHKARHMAIAQSREGAIELAKMALLED